jgi:hypothetical protein
MFDDQPTWAYYVFASKEEEEEDHERRSGVYLHDIADARSLDKFFDPLYDSVGIGLTTSDDEVISGSNALAALAAAIDAAFAEVQERAEVWPVTLGNRVDARTGAIGEPVIEMASRSRILAFLDRVRGIIHHAREIGGYVHFGGGQ